MADDDLWNACVDQGTKRLANMDNEYQPSTLTDFPNLFKEYGWHSQVQPCDPQEDYGLQEDALKTLNISPDVKYWNRYEMTHGNPIGMKPIQNQRWGPNDEYRMTGAKCTLAINKKDGVIMILYQSSPKHEGQDITPPVLDGELPLLQRSSDIMWGKWLQLSNSENIKNIKYFIVHAVTNEITEPILLRAVREKNPEGKVEHWDKRTTVSMHSEEGKALVGTPSATGPVYFLINHQAQLGQRKITEVDIFSLNAYWNWRIPVLVFHLD